MPRYAFEAIGQTGARVRGSLEARNHASALEQLLAGGSTPVLLKEAANGPTFLAQLLSLVGLSSFDYSLVLRELGTLLTAGLPVERALALLQGLSTRPDHVHRLKQILDRVRGGEPLSRAFSSIVVEAPSYISRLIASGEASGHLAQVVTRLAASLARAKTLRGRLAASLTYPAVLLIAMIGVLWVVFHSVLPRLAPMFAEAGAATPAPTRWLLALGWFFDVFGWPLLVIALAIGASLAFAWRRADFRLWIDRTILTTWLLIDLPTRYEAARFCRNLQTLLDGGLSLERALVAARDGSGNMWFRMQIGVAQGQVAEGARLRSAFVNAGVLPPLVIELASVGEETGRLAPMMGEAAQILDEEIESRLDRLTALVLPVATLIMGALVAAIMAGIVSGILAVNDLAS